MLTVCIVAFVALKTKNIEDVAVKFKYCNGVR